MSECERFEERISALLDGELSAEEEAELRAHLEQCPDCRAMYEAFAAVGEAVRAQEVPATLHAGIMSKVRDAQKAHHTQGVLIRLRPILAAAACLVVLVGTTLALGNTLGLGRKATKSASDTAEMTVQNSTATAGGAITEEPALAPAAAPQTDAMPEAATEYNSFFDSKMAVADAPQQAEDKEEPMREAGDNGLLPGAAKIASDSVVESVSDVWQFTLRVEALEEGRLTGTVTDAGDQALFAAGESVTLQTDSVDISGVEPGVCLQVLIGPDAQAENGEILPLALIPTE